MELFGNFKFEEKIKVYKFIVTRIVNWKGENEVVRVIGDHFEDFTNEDIEAVSFTDMKIDRFPRSLNHFFPNLKVLTMNSCGIKSISKLDLVGLKNLRQLTMNGNGIVSIPGNLFEGTPKVETLSFYGNKIKFIDSNIFHALRGLKYANFKMNANIDACFKIEGNGITLKDLKTIVKDKCQPEPYDTIENYFRQLKTFGCTEWIQK